MNNQIPLEPSCYYHIYNRGNNRENIFREEKNYSFFLKQYVKYIEQVAGTYAYCLLKNHFHLLVRIKDFSDLSGFLKPDRSSLSDAFSNFFNSYTKSCNKMYNRTGSLFERPFKRVKVDDETYFTHLICYIHLNPVKHGLTENYFDYPYSSFRAFISEKKTRIKRDEVLQWFGGKDELLRYHGDWSKEYLIRNLMLED